MSYSRETLSAFSEALAKLHASPTSTLPEGMLPVVPEIADDDRRFLLELLRTHLTNENHSLESPQVPSPRSPEADSERFFRLRALGLTPRECEVVCWVAQGKRDAEIAAILGCAPKTVSKHVENLLVKLGGETRLAAARTAQEWLRRQG